MSASRIHVRSWGGRLAAARAVAGGTITVVSVALEVGPSYAGASGCGV